MPSPSPLLSPLHRIPVLWSLYRPLLRLSGKLSPDLQQHPVDPEPKERAREGNALQDHVRRLFRRGQRLGNLQQVKKRLEEAHSVRLCSRSLFNGPADRSLPSSQLLDDLQRAYAGSASHQQQVTLLASHLARHTPPPPAPAPTAPPKPRRSPSILFSTPYRPPLPRLKPQPEHISMMIFNRRRAIQRRWDRVKETKAWAEDGRREAEFEKGLGVERGVQGEWGLEWKMMGSELDRKARKEVRLSQVSCGGRFSRRQSSRKERRRGPSIRR